MPPSLAAGQAEAEAMDKKAAAFAGYNEAAVLQMLIEVLPQVAAEVARADGHIDKLTVISTDGAGELPKQVTDNVVQTMEMLKTTTGLDVESLIQKYSTTNGSTPGLAAASTTDGSPSSLTPSWAVRQPASGVRECRLDAPPVSAGALAERCVTPRPGAATCGSRTAREGAYADPSPLGRT